MFYFDNEYLKQYFDQDIEVQVFVDGDMLNITSKEDINDPVYGVGTDPSGETHTFNYKDIERIKAGSHDLSIDQLQSQQDSESDTEPDDSGEDESEPNLDLPPGTPGADDPGEGESAEKEPKETFKRKSPIIVEVKDIKSPYYGLRGIVLLSNSYGTQYRALNTFKTWRTGDVITIWN